MLFRLQVSGIVISALLHTALMVFLLRVPGPDTSTPGNRIPTKVTLVSPTHGSAPDPSEKEKQTSGKRNGTRTANPKPAAVGGAVGHTRKRIAATASAQTSVPLQASPPSGSSGPSAGSPSAGTSTGASSLRDLLPNGNAEYLRGQADIGAAKEHTTGWTSAAKLEISFSANLNRLRYKLFSSGAGDSSYVDQILVRFQRDFQMPDVAYQKRLQEALIFDVQFPVSGSFRLTPVMTTGVPEVDEAFERVLRLSLQGQPLPERLRGSLQGMKLAFFVFLDGNPDPSAFGKVMQRFIKVNHHKLEWEMLLKILEWKF